MESGTLRIRNKLIPRHSKFRFHGILLITLNLSRTLNVCVHSQISKFCKLSFDRSFLGRTWRVWWNCLSVIGLMPKLPPSSILRGPSDCPNAALWPGSHPSPVPPSSTWFPTKVDDPRFILPDMASPARTHSFGDDGLTLGFHILCLFKSSLGSPGASLAMCRPQSTATRKPL